MFNISIWLPTWLPNPYTTGSSEDDHDILTSCFMAPSLKIEPHHSPSPDSTSNTTLLFGCTNIQLSTLPFLSIEPINNFPVRTNPFLSGKVSTTFASFHSFCLEL